MKRDFWIGRDGNVKWSKFYNSYKSTSPWWAEEFSRENFHRDRIRPGYVTGIVCRFYVLYDRKFFCYIFFSLANLLTDK